MDLEKAMLKIVDSNGVHSDPDSLQKYGADETEDFVFPPKIVVRPQSTQQISQIMRFAWENQIPVTPRGGGTGLSGGALPIFGGICLSLERLNRILEIDKKNLMAVVEPGVITETFQKAVEELGLFYPPDPASRGSCMLGGNIAENSGGPRAVKYGVTKDYVYGLEVVLPNGDVINTGGKLLKNVTGYNLTQLFVGSEGTLGIVTKIIFKLIPLPKAKMTLLIPFPSLKNAAETVTDIFHARITPSACEFMEKAAIDAASEHLGKTFPFPEAQAQLLVEVDGNREDVLMDEAEKIGEIAMQNGAADVWIAQTSAQQQEIWAMRRCLGLAVKSVAVYKEEDTVVPRAQLPDLLERVKEIAGRYGITTVCYGHAGDGNIHVNILKKNVSEETWARGLEPMIQEIFKATVALGGTISGEHGIGYTQKNYLPIAMSPEDLAALRLVKKAFDPRGIMNPGKLLPDHI